MRKYISFCVGFVFGAALLSPIARGQDSGATVASPANLTATAGSAPGASAATKVWTNDDLSGPRAADGPSNNAKAPAKKPASSQAKTTAKTPSVAYYQQQISKLQAELPAIDSQIADLQGALAGKPVTGVRQYGSQRPDDWQAQLAQLQKKRAGITGQIESLEDQARHNGIPPSSLP